VPNVPKAQPWAKRRAPSPSWKPTPEDIFRNLPTIRRAVRRAGTRPGDVDDVAADVIGQAWQALPRFKGYPHDMEGSFRGWLSVLAWRLARDRRLREKMEFAVDMESAQDAALLFPSPHERVAARFALRRVGCLFPKYRQLAILLALTGSLTDAAEIAGIPIGTASTRARKLRRALRKWGLR